MPGWDEYRKRQAALRTAAELATCGPVAAIDEALAARGLGGVFATPDELAREAQQKWWLRLLGRLDGDLGDDLNAMPDQTRLDTVRAAWLAQSAAMPGYWALATSSRNRRISAERDRYAALLALYAGRADPSDDRATIVAVGHELVRHLEAGSERRPVTRRRLRRRQAEHLDIKLRLMQNSSYFAGQPQQALVALSHAADLLDAAPGEALVVDARPGQWWWFVLDGVVDVVAGERPVAELRAGHSFGPEPRVVDQLAPLGLVARSAALVLVARRPEFTALLAAHPNLASVVDPHVPATVSTGSSGGDRELLPADRDALPKVSDVAAAREHRQVSRRRKAG